MTTICSQLGLDTTTRKACEAFNRKLDRPSPQPLPAAKQLTTTGAKSNLESLLRQATNRSSFNVGVTPGRAHKLQKSISLKSLTRKAKPWDIQNAALLRRLKGGIHYLRRKLKRKRRWKTKKAFNTALARLIVSWVTLPKRLGGLGLRPITIPENKVWRQRTAEEILLAKTKSCPAKKPCGEHCFELNNVLFPLFKMAGFKPKHLLVYKHLNGKVSLEHVCIGLQLDPKRPHDFTQVDLGLPRSKWIGKHHPGAFPLSEAAMMSIHFSNKAVTLYRKHKHQQKIPQTVVRKIKALFATGMKWDAKNPFVLYMLANFHVLVEGDLVKAVECLNAALNSYPTYKDARDLLQRIKKSRTHIMK